MTDQIREQIQRVTRTCAVPIADVTAEYAVEPFTDGTVDADWGWAISVKVKGPRSKFPSKAHGFGADITSAADAAIEDVGAYRALWARGS